MAEKINYKEYLSQFGKIETDAKNRIKSYLEEQIKQDAALKGLYQPEKIDDCYNFIKEAVRATGCGQSATVEDEIVFKMARDYYLDILPKQAEEPAEVKETGAETATEADSEAETELKETTADNENTEDAESENEQPEAVLHQAGDEGEKSEGIENSEAETEQEPESAPADNENEAEKDYCGFEVFGEDEAPEESAETAATTETETKAEPENEKPEPFIPKYDEEGNGLLFDF